MCKLYRASDYTVLCSLGEGFGIPLIESMACGTPCIFSNFSATPEVVGPGGLPVDWIESVPFELSSSFQFIPSTKMITQRFIETYQDWKSGGKMRDELGEKGREHVLQNYTLDVVRPKWLKLVEEPAKVTIPEAKATVAWINENKTGERTGGAELTSKELIEYGRKIGYGITEITPANFNVIFDLLVVNNIRTFPGLFIEGILQRDFVFLCHDTRVFMPKQEMWIPIYQMLFDRAKKVIFLSPLHRKCYQETFSIETDKIAVFPPPINPDIYYEAEKEEVCVYTGLIAKHKGIENVIVKAIEMPELEFRLYGREIIAMLITFPPIDIAVKVEIGILPGFRNLVEEVSEGSKNITKIFAGAFIGANRQIKAAILWQCPQLFSCLNPISRCVNISIYSMWDIDNWLC
ncbi:hypothetical protein ES703_44607 [subsurface metagenome]